MHDSLTVAAYVLACALIVHAGVIIVALVTLGAFSRLVYHQVKQALVDAVDEVRKRIF